MSTEPRRCQGCGQQSPREAERCTACGEDLGGEPGAPAAPPSPHPAREVVPAPAAPPPAPTFVWDHAFPLLTNGFFLLDMVKVWGITLLVVGLLFLVILAGDLGDWPPIMGMMALVVGGLFVLSILISLVFFGNRMGTRFTVSPDGALVEMTSRRARWANRCAFLLGALAGRPGTMGAGLLAMSGESVEIAWGEVHRVGEYPRSRTITLSNSWRTVLRLYCLPENYEPVRAAVREYTRHGPKPRRPRSAASRRYVRRGVFPSVLTLACWLLLFATPFEPAVALVVALLAVAFLAVWWSGAARFWGVLVLFGAVTYGVLTIAAGLQVHMLISPEVLGDTPASPWMRPNGFALLEGAEWLRLGIATVGWVWFLWLGTARTFHSSREPHPEAESP